MRTTVKDVMTTDVVVARDSMSYKEIAWLTDAKNVSALPVVGEDGVLVGIVSEADLLLKEERTYTKRRRPGFGRHGTDRRKAAGAVARQLMTTPVVTTTPEASIAEAARLMHAHGVKRLPVVDARGRIAGIVSRKDLLKVFLRPDDEIRREVVEDVMNRTLWLTPEESGIIVEVRDGVVHLQGWLERKSLIEILVGLVLGVEGVVTVDNRLGFKFDDTHLRPESPLPWGVLPKSLRAP